MTTDGRSASSDSPESEDLTPAAAPIYHEAATPEELAESREKQNEDE